MASRECEERHSERSERMALATGKNQFRFPDQNRRLAPYRSGDEAKCLSPLHVVTSHSAPTSPNGCRSARPVVARYSLPNSRPIPMKAPNIENAQKSISAA